MPDEAKRLEGYINSIVGPSLKGRFQIDPFNYTTEFLPIAASITQTGQFTVQADSAFAIMKTNGTVATTGNVFIANISDTPRYTPFTLTWTDSGSGREIMDTPVSWDSVVGTGQRPSIWPKPKILDPNSTFSTRLNNLVATAFNVRLHFIGYKIFGSVELYKQLRAVKEVR